MTEGGLTTLEMRFLTDEEMETSRKEHEEYWERMPCSNCQRWVTNDLTPWHWCLANIILPTVKMTCKRQVPLKEVEP